MVYIMYPNDSRIVVKLHSHMTTRLFVGAIAFLGIGILVYPDVIRAESTSENYVIWGSTFVNSGNRGTSANYVGFASIGDLSNGPTASANYRQVIGFEAIYKEPVLTFTLTPNSVTLSPSVLTTGVVSTNSFTATVSTNADFGYTLTGMALSHFQSTGGHQMTDVEDGSVTAWSEECGVSVSGTDAAFGDDRSLTTTPRTLATNTIYGASLVTTITFKAAISTVTDVGAYTGTYAFIATGHY